MLTWMCIVTDFDNCPLIYEIGGKKLSLNKNSNEASQ